MSNLDTFFPEASTIDTQTIESLAWNLITNDDKMADYGSIVTAITETPENNVYEQMACQFEMLISLFMEIISQLSKIEYISKNMENDIINDEINVSIQQSEHFRNIIRNLHS